MSEAVGADGASRLRRQVLSGVRVVDLSRWVAGEFATKLFADFGADVMKVERPGRGQPDACLGAVPRRRTGP